VNFFSAGFGLGATAHKAGDFRFGELLGLGFGELDVCAQERTFDRHALKQGSDMIPPVLLDFEDNASLKTSQSVLIVPHREMRVKRTALLPTAS
jgi:hypothetical protein